ncbi:hypothetical protein AWENTII_007694 [Aspergillus wentii]
MKPSHNYNYIFVFKSLLEAKHPVIPLALSRSMLLDANMTLPAPVEQPRKPTSTAAGKLAAIADCFRACSISTDRLDSDCVTIDSGHQTCLYNGPIPHCLLRDGKTP